MSIPLLPGYRREMPGPSRGQFAKSQTLNFQHAVPREIHSGARVDPRSVLPPSSFNGTGNLAQHGVSMIKGAGHLTATSHASNHSASGRLEQPVEKAFATHQQRAAEDKYAHLRRAPVAKDFANTADPLAHLQISDTRLPSYVEYANQVLRFRGYFKEAVHGSANETWRIRPILLYYYLEDDSIHMAEPPTGNSGLHQGVFIKRHRIPKDETGSIFLPEDLFIGAELPIYGRVFRLTDADGFTRAFYDKNGHPLAEEAETVPEDPFASRSVDPKALTFKKQLHPTSNHQEAALGKHFHGGIAATQQFLKNDRKVLRFYGTITDTKMFGEKKAYIVHVYLADDTIEVVEVKQPNSGYAGFTHFMKRGKLPKDHTRILRDVAHLGGDPFQFDPQMQHYTDADFRIGRYINVYGRDLFLQGCDAYTHKYYKEHYGLTDEELASIDMKDPESSPPKIAVPPYLGFGIEEDSLGSFIHLVPRQPKTDQQKLVLMDGILLRFAAQFSNPPAVDKDRKFIITYWTSNDTMQIFELFERNVGHIAGKFLDRCRCMNVRRGEYFSPRDLYVGGLIEVHKHEFRILDCDVYTENFIQSQPHIWNAEEGNLPDWETSLRHTGGKKLDWKASTASNTLPDKRPF